MHLSQLPLNALRAFDATARHESFTLAAEELCVTAGAVAKQVRVLESLLGEKLVARKGPRISLTKAGAAALPRLQRGFDELLHAVADIHRAAAGPSINVAADTTFAAMWLAPRLKAFQDQGAPCRVSLISQIDSVTSTAHDVDIVISSILPRPPGFDEILLHTETFLPVMSPKIFGTLTPRTPRDILKAPLIGIDPRIEGAIKIGWEQWFARNGIIPETAPTITFVTLNILAFQAAVTHQGVILASQLLVADYLKRGDLIAPLGVEFGLDVPRYIYVRTGRFNSLVQQFTDWLIANQSGS
nr:LysR substrate-binding domain-containing protein [uncultured Roseovarius sp.]